MPIKEPERKGSGKAVIAVIVVIIALAVTTGACERVYERFGIEQDNIAEELFEAIIEKELHIPVDLTPETPESSCQKQKVQY